jgi:hypothetical protein
MCLEAINKAVATKRSAVRFHQHGWTALVLIPKFAPAINFRPTTGNNPLTKRMQRADMHATSATLH